MKRKLDVLQDVDISKLNNESRPLTPATPTSLSPTSKPTKQPASPKKNVITNSDTGGTNICTGPKRDIHVPRTKVRIRVPGDSKFTCARLDTLFEQRPKTPLLLFFYDSMTLSATEYIKKVAKHLPSQHRGNFVLVSNDVSDAPQGTSQIEDTSGHLAGELRALSPIGCGIVPLDCLVFLDGNLKHRAFAPLSKIDLSDFLNVINGSLDYLKAEEPEL